QRHVVERAIRRRRGAAEGPRALVGVLLAPAVVPGVEVGIGRGLLELVGQDRRAAVGAGVAVGPDRLVRARRQAAAGVADEGVLDVRAADAVVGVPAAVLRAQAGGLVDVARGQHEVHALGVARQRAA